MKSLFLKAYPILSLAVFAIAPLPFIALGVSFYFETENLSLVEQRLQMLEQKQTRSQAEEKKEKRFLEQLKQADPFYIDKQLGTLSFQEKEIHKLRLLVQSDEDKKRLQFLETANRLSFTQKAAQSCDWVQEVEEQQEYPIEVNEDDLKKLLLLIEHVPIPPYSLPEKAPQMVIKHLHLDKKHISLYQSVFLLNMELIKREGVSR